MSLALILILILPLLCRLYRRWGWGCFFITLVFSVFPSEPRLFSYLHYLPGAALGLCLAGGNGYDEAMAKALSETLDEKTVAKCMKFARK